MHFMADLEVPCEECQGKRFQEKVLGVRYRDRNIHEVLQMTVAQAIAFFQGHTPIVHRLQPLVEVGLDYLRLGQTTATLSGGEAQRMALAGYLGRKHSQGAKDRMLFLFDEPTVGLHLKDIDVLLKALRRVVAEGHSVIVVEHNTDLIAQADHVIDLGPEGGDAGGSLVAQGTPAEVAAVPQSWTGRFLAELFHGGLDAAG
jgi:excinuclease ABC subunit A